MVWKPCKMFIYVCMYACVYVQYICFTRWLSTNVFHSWSLRYAFDPATTSSVVYGVYVGTEWGPQIRFCVSVTSRSRSKIRINVRKPIQNSNDDLKTPLDARWCRATNAKCITYLARGLYRPILRRTQLETHEHKVKFKRKSIAAVNCTRRRPLTIAKRIAWHVRSGEPNIPSDGVVQPPNNLKFHHNTFKSTFQSLPDVQIQFPDKFSLSTFQGEFKFYSFKAMQGYWFVDFMIFIIIYV